MEEGKVKPEVRGRIEGDVRGGGERNERRKKKNQNDINLSTLLQYFARPQAVIIMRVHALV